MKWKSLWLALLITFPFQNACAWETDIESKHSGWLSIYNSMGRSLQEEARRKDEHLALSDWALRALGVSEYTYNSNPVMITDLNASYFRRDELGKLGGYPSNPDAGGLEIRQLPAPSHFSGVPDFSYAMHDWINKNNYCPPKEGLVRCHKFKGWMGALNSNHFGTQAKNSYWHLHKLAVKLAIHAKQLREKIKADKTALTVYKEYLREAEREALSVEGYAQHFLQDRWSTGHMWERWDAPDYGRLPEKGLVSNLVIGAFSGMLHGSEGITGMPDALSSPQVSWKQARNNYLRKVTPKYFKGLLDTEEGFIIPHWKQAADKAQQSIRFDGFPGVGDDRFLDMLDGHFGKEYKSVNRDYALNIGGQRDMMKQCLMAGWAEVIRSFGSNPRGGFGIEAVQPKGDVKGFSSLHFQCDDQWATNASIAVGWMDNMSSFGQAARTFVRSATDVSYLLSDQRKALLRLHYRIKSMGTNKQTRNGTELARGYIGSFGKFATGNHYPKIADYLEPEDINMLPEKDKKGKDKNAWFGFFNRAHSDYWCENSSDIFAKVRGSDDAFEQATCNYLADRFYEGTDPEYKGKQSEIRTRTGQAGGEKVSSICSLLKSRPSAFDENTPSYLHPGYVEKPYALNKNKKVKSISNWCRKLPVINYIPDDSGQIKSDRVAKIDDWKTEVRLTGYNLGDKPGKLILKWGTGSTEIGSNEISAWSAEALSFHLPEAFEDYAKEGDGIIHVVRADGGRDIGHFLLVYDAGEEVEISGTISSSDGKALSGATASVEIESKKYSGTSGSDGHYQITVPKKVQVPDSVFVMAAKEGFNTASRTISKEGLDKADFTLSAASKYLVQIDQGLHHLGNGQFGGSINSQFQQSSAEGSRYEKSFELDEEQLPPKVVAVRLLLSVKGAEEDNPIAINGTKIGTLNSSNGDGSASVTEFDFDICSIKSGNNSFIITAADSNANGDIDDFEFTNVQLKLTPLEDINQLDDKQLAKLSSVSISDESFTKPVSIMDKDGQFWIKAKGKSRCANAKGVARVLAYVKGAAESERAAIVLMETGPGTSEFRSSEAVSVAKLGATEGQTIVIRAGMRGVNVKVKDPNAEKLRELKRKLKLVKAAKAEWDDLRDQWKRFSDVVDEQRAAGKDVSDLMRNLRPLTARVQQARGRYVELTGKHGSIKSLEAEIIKLDPSYMPQPTSVNKPLKPGPSSSPAGSQANGSTATDTGSSKPEKPKPPTSGAQGGTSSTTAAGSNAPATTANAQPKAKPAAVKSERWDAYKLQVRARNSGLPNINVVKIAFNLTSTRAEMRIRHYPVSLMRDENSGVTLWKVNWSGGEIADQQSSNSEEGMNLLTAKAHKLRHGSVGKSAVDGLIKQQLGSNARRL